MKFFFKYWVWAVTWMAVIFDMSTEVGSPRHSGQLLQAFLRWLGPKLTRNQIDFLNLLSRKMAHLFEYGILAMLLYYAIHMTFKRTVRGGWSWSSAGWALLICALYGAADEFHQCFVASRHPSGWDVLIDTTGAGLGLLILHSLYRIFAPLFLKRTEEASIETSRTPVS